VGETAISENGSRTNKWDFELFHHYLIRYGSGSEHTLYVQPTHSGYSLDDGAVLCMVARVGALGKRPSSNPTIPIAAKQQSNGFPAESGSEVVALRARLSRNIGGFDDGGTVSLLSLARSEYRVETTR
jgi:hypothetical protein